MSISETNDGTEESAHSPPPTAHEATDKDVRRVVQAEYDHGCTLTRRQAMQATGATIATLALAGTASADDDSGSDEFLDRGTFYRGVQYSYAATNPGTTAAIFAAGAVYRELNESPNADQIALHTQAERAREWWDDMYTIVFDNRLTDAKMAAHIAGRQSIADAWEDGKTASQAYDDVLNTFEEFYDVPARNITETAWSTLSELGYVSAVARADDDVPDRFVAFTPLNDDYSGDAVIEDDGDVSYIDSELVECDVTLPSGYVHTHTAPEIHVGWDNGDSLTFRLDDDLLEHYDEDEERFVGVETDQGETVDFDGVLTVYAVPEHDLKTGAVFDISEWAQYLAEIEARTDEVKANYDPDWIGELFDALDDGTIDVKHIRGVEGLAEYLSGTTEVTQSRYQMALAMLLDLDRPDLSDVASMQMTYQGFTGRSIDRDGDEVNIRLVDHEEDLFFDGTLFGDLYGDTTLSPDSRYAANPFVFCPNDDEGALIYDLTADDYTVVDIPDLTTDTNTGHISRDGTRMAIGSGDEVWFALDTETLEITHEEDTGGERVWSVRFNPQDSDQLAVGHDGGSYVYDLGSGTKVDLYGSSTYALAWSPDGSKVALGDTGPRLRVFDAETGSEEWVNGELWDTQSLSDLDYAPNGEFIAAAADSDGYIGIFDPDDGSIIWEPPTPASRSPNGLSISPDSSMLYYQDGDNWVVYDVDAEEELYQESDGGIHRGQDGVWLPDNTLMLFLSDEVRIVDPTNGQVIEHRMAEPKWSEEYHLWPRPEDTPGGIIQRAMAIDGLSGDDYLLTSGTVHVEKLFDSEGNEVDEDYEGKWDRPGHDEQDNEEYREYIERVTEEHVEAIADDDEGGDDNGGSIGLPVFENPFEDSDAILGFAVIGAVVLGAIAVATDFLTNLLPWTR